MLSKPLKHRGNEETEGLTPGFAIQAHFLKSKIPVRKTLIRKLQFTLHFLCSSVFQRFCIWSALPKPDAKITSTLREQF